MHAAMYDFVSGFAPRCTHSVLQNHSERTVQLELEYLRRWARRDINEARLRHEVP